MSKSTKNGGVIVPAGEIARRVRESIRKSRVERIRELSRPLAEEVNPQTLEAMRVENIELRRQVKVVRGTVEFMWNVLDISGERDRDSSLIEKYLDERSLPWDCTADQIIAANLNRDRENGGHSS